MTGNAESREDLLSVLREREKELNCLYHVEEYLNNRRFSIPEMFEGIVRTIPSGLQFPELCQARIVYMNLSYQTPGFISTCYSETNNIQVNGRTVGKLEVSYVREVPKSENGYFLEKESKLMKTIADRIGQTILYWQMEQLQSGWESLKDEPAPGGSEWRVIVDLLYRTDKDMLSHICRKMINYLSWHSADGMKDVLHRLDTNRQVKYEPGEQNHPSEKKPMKSIEEVCENTFAVASKLLNDYEITARIKKWIQEEKAHSLIKVIDQTNASLQGIIDAVARYRKMAIDVGILSPHTERWMKTSLLRRFFSDKLDFLKKALQHVEISDFYELLDRIIFPDNSHGKLGGKSTGLFLARQVLRRESEKNVLLQSVNVPATWYVTSDAFTDFLLYNDLEDINGQKYKDLTEIRMEYPDIIQLIKSCKFPPKIVRSLSMLLDDLGDKPLIVRSSSLLEDQIGSAFSGKYKSLFLANQGSKKERLEALMDAMKEVYASVFSPDSIQYRAEHGFLDFPEEMGIMVQEVVGTRVGRYFFPMFSGVAFSNNEFRWSPRIRREDGLIRLVPGLGTRAVDRVSDDFPVLVSPGQPGLRVNATPDEIRRYSPRRMDVINLESNAFETVEVSEVFREYGDMIPDAHHIVSIDKKDHMEKPMAFTIDFKNDAFVTTFEGLISDTRFIRQLDTILKTLKEKLGMPVDIEFAYDGNSFFLLQCRPQSFAQDCAPSPIPQDIPSKDIIFNAKKYISNGRIPDISYIVYVDPDGYSRLHSLDELVSVGRITGLLNSMLPKRRFILMGPGRWGSRGDIKMGVQVGYSDINNTAVLIEIARRKSGYVPELSFGTHFFQDLVESNIRYLPIYPDDEGIIFNEAFLTRSKNILPELLPQYAGFADVFHVIDVSATADGRILKILCNADLGEAVAFLGTPDVTVDEEESPVMEPQARRGEDFWRWRHYMAEKIAESLDFARFGVEGIYLFGSTNHTSAGPGSDIDLLVHFSGSPAQREQLMLWFEGWSLCLSEINYLKTGYKTNGLLDVQIVTDKDIEGKTCFAVKIGAPNDPAYPLKLKTPGAQ